MVVVIGRFAFELVPDVSASLGVYAGGSEAVGGREGGGVNGICGCVFGVAAPVPGTDGLELVWRSSPGGNICLIS